jgi:hypothetical protein
MMSMKNALVQRFGQQELGEAPARGHPAWRNQEQQGLAAVGGGFQRALPPLPGHQAGFGVDVEEDVVEPLLRQPISARAAGLLALEWLRNKRAIRSSCSRNDATLEPKG